MCYMMLLNEIEYCVTIAFKLLYDNSNGGNVYVSSDAVE